MQQIPNSELKIDCIPECNAGLRSIFAFALTFDGYKTWGQEECATIANARRHETLTDLRTCLFFEQRRWHHFGYEPDKEAEAYFRELIGMIRQRVADGDLA
jgi:hypothetical protein